MTVLSERVVGVIRIARQLKEFVIHFSLGKRFSLHAVIST